MDITIPHTVTYEFAGRASVGEVAKTLVAQERLVREALAVLEELFPNLIFESADVAVRALTQDSPLKTHMEALVVAAYAAELGEDVPDVLNTLFGINVPDSYDSIVSVLVLLIAIWGIDWVRAKIFPGKKAPELLNERERLLVTAAAQASVTRDHLEEAVDTTLNKHKRSVMKASADFLAPAKKHDATAVRVGEAAITESAIKAMPSDLDFAQYEPPTETVPYERVQLQFRAHDLDRNKAWGAIIAEVSPDRKPLHLAPDVRPENLFERTKIRADVLVTSVRDAEGDYVPTLYYLQKVYDEDAS